MVRKLLGPVTLLLDNDAVRRVLNMRDCIAALEGSFGDLAAGNAVDRPRSHTYTDLGDGRHYLFKSMDGALPRLGVHAIRLSSDLTHEHDGRRDKIPAAPGGRYVGLVLLFDQETLVPLALLHDGELQRIRVGATSALAAGRLARPAARIAAVIGAGWQAGPQLEGLRAVRELDEVRVFAPTRPKLEAFCAEHGATPATSAREAIEGADLVALSTNSHVPVIDGDWLEPGQHVGSVQVREVDARTLERADLIVQRSDVEPTFHFVNGHQPVEAGDVASPDGEKTVTLADVVAGRFGRSSRDEITLFTGGSAGLGTQFAAVAHAVYTAAREQGIGRELPTEWFTQEEKP
jgi:ornithine cyclodeaminase/alanine dehydrogenase-like protein (mu-crystallin family)